MMTSRDLPLLLLLTVAACQSETPPRPELSPPGRAPAQAPVPTPPIEPAPTPAGTLGKGTPHATDYYELRGAEPGPAVLIEAGIHGDEIAGTLALDALLPRLRINKGRVVLMPRMNRPAVQANKRFLEEDLNLVFPGDAGSKVYERRLAAELFAWIGAMEVDVVVTLHESRYLHDGKTHRKFGQTIVYGVKPMPPLLGRVLKRVNVELAEPRHKFWPNYFPIETSSTEQFVARWKVEGFCVETWRGLDLDQRVALQEEVVLAFFTEAGIEYSLEPMPTTALEQLDGG